MTVLRPDGGRWTAADLDRIPDDGVRCEVINGQLIVHAPPIALHQWLINRLVLLLDAAAPDDLVVVDGIGVLSGDDEPVPDLVVVSGGVDRGGRGVPVSRVELVVEVVSRSTAMQDRMVKPVLYAQAGIPSYWRFEVSPFDGRLPGEQLPVLFTYALGPHGSYEQIHRASAGVPVTLRSPFRVTIDPAVLIPR